MARFVSLILLLASSAYVIMGVPTCTEIGQPMCSWPVSTNSSLTPPLEKYLLEIFSELLIPDSRSRVLDTELDPVRKGGRGRGRGRWLYGRARLLEAWHGMAWMAHRSHGMAALSLNRWPFTPTSPAPRLVRMLTSV